MFALLRLLAPRLSRPRRARYRPGPVLITAEGRWIHTDGTEVAR